MFELGQDGVRKKSDMRFEISERSFEDEFQFKRVTQGMDLYYLLSIIWNFILKWFLNKAFSTFIGEKSAHA